MQLIFDATTASEALEAGPSESACSSTAAASGRTGTTRRSARTGAPDRLPGRGLTRDLLRGRDLHRERAPGLRGRLRQRERAAARVWSRARSSSRRTHGPAALSVADLRGPLGPAGVRVQQRPDRPEHQAAVAASADHAADAARVEPAVLPGNGIAGPTITSAFCGAIAHGLDAHQPRRPHPRRRGPAGARDPARDHRPPALTRWRPVDLEPLRAERTFGQMVRAARQLYGRHWLIAGATRADRGGDHRGPRRGDLGSPS